MLDRGFDSHVAPAAARQDGSGSDGAALSQKPCMKRHEAVQSRRVCAMAQGAHRLNRRTVGQGSAVSARVSNSASTGYRHRRGVRYSRQGILGIRACSARSAPKAGGAQNCRWTTSPDLPEATAQPRTCTVLELLLRTGKDGRDAARCASGVTGSRTSESPAAVLRTLKGIGPEFTMVLWSEGLFRHFMPTEGSLPLHAGLAPTPWRERRRRSTGASASRKPRNSRLRPRPMIQAFSWLWLMTSVRASMALHLVVITTEPNQSRRLVATEGMSSSVDVEKLHGRSSARS